MAPTLNEPLVDALRRIANECANEGLHPLALDLNAKADRLEEALTRMAQPDYGDTTAALDFYAEGVNLIMGRGLYG